ncbi:MAG TPA: TlpA disulfide reductase family protein [Pedobacter sp.]|jgi:peroxiredoxin
MRAIAALFFGFTSMLILGCNTSEDLPFGIWRGVLKTESGVEIPFNFEVTESYDDRIVYLNNGEERLKVDEVIINHDSVYFKFKLFDSEIKAKITSSGLTGKWIKRLADKNSVMGFTAQPGTNWRFFSNSEKIKSDFSGRWATVFRKANSSDTTIAVGEFSQLNGKLIGTFLTATGDYRFLEGTVNNSKIYLSAFDGSSAYLFTGDLSTDSLITNGLFYSGANSVKKWTARKDDHAKLPDSEEITKLKSLEDPLVFSFPDIDGKKVSLSDERFKNKVLVVQFLGSWCPNCMDETAYLTSFYDKFKDKGVEIIGLAYERTNDFNRSRERVLQLRERFNIQYPLLLTGYTNKEVLTSLPQLEKFKAFPTTLIIDKKGLVRKIHTGFNGPGTGRHYQDFIDQFETEITDLLK